MLQPDILTVSHSITVAVAYFDWGAARWGHILHRGTNTHKKATFRVYDLRANSKHQMFVKSENCKKNIAGNEIAVLAGNCWQSLRRINVT